MRARPGIEQVGLPEQGKGLGEALLKDAIKRHLQAQAILGGRALVAHAKDRRAAAFSERYGFQPSPIDALRLYLLTKDMKKTLGMRQASCPERVGGGGWNQTTVHGFAGHGITLCHPAVEGRKWGRNREFQSTVAPDALMTLDHLSISTRMCVAKYSRLPPIGTRPSLAMRLFMSALCMMRSIVAFNWLSMAI